MTSQKALAANRYPYPKEEAVLRAHVAGAEEEQRILARRRQESLLVVEAARRDVEAAERVLEAAREALESAQIMHDGIAESCRALDARVGLARARLHPVRRLSDDVLGEIFQVMVDGLNLDNGRDPLLASKAPFTVSQVCRRWRIAALGRPRLWQNVNLDMDHVGLALRKLDAQAAKSLIHSCKWCRFLHFHLQHSRSLHLYVRVIAQEGHFALPTRHIWTLLATASPRMRTLDIEYGGDDTVGLNSLLETDMPVLETAVINCTSFNVSLSPSPLEIVFFKKAPRLHRCVMHHCDILWTTSETQIFPALTSLEFFGGTSSGHKATPDELHSLLARCPGLRQVKIDLAHFDNDPQARQSNVSIAVREHDSNVFANSIVFPSAERLEVLLGPLHASRTMIAACASTLTSVVIHKRSVAAAFASSLAASVLLKSIELVQCKVVESFFKEMATPLADGTLTCPMLQKLHLRDSTSVTLDGFTGDGLLRLIRLRNDEAAKGAGITRLSDVMVSWLAQAKVTLVDDFEQQLQDLLK